MPADSNFFTRMVGHKPLLYIIILIDKFWIFAKRFKYVGVKRWPVGEHAGGSHRLKTWIKMSLASSATQHYIGSATRQTRDAMGFRALDNLDAFFAGNTPGDRL